MKVSRLLTFIFAVFLTLSSCTEDGKSILDPCAGITCENGECINGDCDCDPGYSGPSCANELRPVSIILTRVQVTQFPQTNDQGGGWDSDGTGPDIYIRVYSGGNEVYESDHYQDAINTSNYTFDLNPDVNLPSTSDFGVSLYDREFIVSDTFMGGVVTGGEVWTSYLLDRGFPSTTTFTANAGYTFICHWTYVH
tara:strand:+ start:267 stop:851 length:585 start_codon:yes stop_codon:yes gene_type:complete